MNKFRIHNLIIERQTKHPRWFACHNLGSLFLLVRRETLKTKLCLSNKLLTYRCNNSIPGINMLHSTPWNRVITTFRNWPQVRPLIFITGWLAWDKHAWEKTGNTYGLLTKCDVKMAGYCPSSFFVCLWTETKSRFINTQKKKKLG